MLNFSGVNLRRGPLLLLEDLSLTIHAGQRVGLTGRNGSGKSSLFALLLGELAPDAGELTRPRELTIAHVRQETPGLARSALDFVLDGDAEWRQLHTAIAAAEQGGDASKLPALHERYDAIDGYQAESRAARMLAGLGFAPEAIHRPVREFSGGWRVRLNLAQALMCRADLLLLDEPTNHLDFDAVLWLQGHLASHAGTLIVISHDRDFLDEVTDHTLHIEHRRGTLYRGGYSASERQRAERMAQQAARYKAESRRAAELQRFIDRFRAKATKARQAQSRIKQLERLELAEPAHWDDPFDFGFLEPERLPAPLLRYDDVAAGYDGEALLTGLNCQLEPGDRVGVLGRNGAGKSTLLRTLAGTQPELSGRVLRDPYTRVGYFTQHQVDSLDLAASPIAHLQRMNPTATDQALRNFLGGFDFRGDQVFAAVESFSGGEKARLALALLVYTRPNLLLLDEPTNHLDLEMRHALERALQGYAGAVIIVAHDRHLLATCTDRLWVVEDGGLREFDGDLDDYAQHVRQAARGAAPARPANVAAGTAREQRQAAAAQRQREKPLREAVQRCEREMEKHGRALAALEEKLSDAELYQNDPDRAAALAREQGQLRKALQQAEQAWLEAAEALEEAQQATPA